MGDKGKISKIETISDSKKKCQYNSIWVMTRRFQKNGSQKKSLLFFGFETYFEKLAQKWICLQLYQDLFLKNCFSLNAFQLVSKNNYCYIRNFLYLITENGKKKLQCPLWGLGADLSLLKPNHFKKQCSSSSFLLTWSKYTSPKWAWSTRQANFMHLKHGTSLLSTPWPFWTCIFTSGK